MRRRSNISYYLVLLILLIQLLMYKKNKFGKMLLNVYFINQQIYFEKAVDIFLPKISFRGG